MSSDLPKLPLLGQSVQRPVSVTGPTEEILQDHYVRLQKTLMSAVDKELDDMNSVLRETAEDLKRTEDDKTAIGVALYEANSKIGRMNSQLEI